MLKSDDNNNNNHNNNNLLLLAVGLSFYNDDLSLSRCLDSIVFNLPMSHTKVIAIDGKYKGYRDKEPLSTDGSRNTVREYQDRFGKDTFQLFDCPNLHERFKRQKYVDIAAQQGFRFLLILDSDEWLECKSPPDLLDELKSIDQAWYDRLAMESKEHQNPPIAGIDKVPKVGNVHMIQCIDKDDRGYVTNAVRRPRLWYRPQVMRYTTKHFYWISEDYPSESQPVKSFLISNLQMWHSHDLRTEDRERKRILYERDSLPRLEE